MPAPVIAAIIGAAGTTAGAAIAAHGSSSASKTQAQTAQEALDFEKAQLAKKQAALTPYENNGLAAGNQLDFLLGLTPSDNATGAPSPLVARQPSVPFQPNASVSLNGQPPVQQFQGKDGRMITVPANSDPHYWDNLAARQGWTPLGQPRSGQPMASNMSTLAAPSSEGPQTGSNGVLMRAPDGSQQLVPAAQVAHYQQLGAVPVGTA